MKKKCTKKETKAKKNTWGKLQWFKEKEKIIIIKYVKK
jgi:hypothetical protein